MNKKGWKQPKKVFRPAFGWPPHPKSVKIQNQPQTRSERQNQSAEHITKKKPNFEWSCPVLWKDFGPLWYVFGVLVLALGPRPTNHASNRYDVFSSSPVQIVEPGVVGRLIALVGAVQLLFHLAQGRKCLSVFHRFRRKYGDFVAVDFDWLLRGWWSLSNLDGVKEIC